MSRRLLTLAIAAVTLACAAPAAAVAGTGTVTLDTGTHTATFTDAAGDDVDVTVLFSSDHTGVCTAGCDAFSILSSTPGTTFAASAPCAVQNNTPVCPDTAANPIRNYVLNTGDGKDNAGIVAGSGSSSFCYDTAAIDTGPGDDRINASGSRTPSCPGYAETATLHGGDGADRILGGPGNDQIFGDGGDDLVLRGENGNDAVHGGDGNDMLGDFNYADPLTLDPGADSYDGGAGTDSLSYEADGTGVSVSLDGQANDGAGGEGDNVAGDIETITGGSGNDTLSGDGGATTLSGRSGNDTLIGNGGNDTLEGGAGNDTVQGGAGDDRLIGDADDDALDGGAGRDSFFGDGVDCNGFSCPSGNDTVNADEGELDQVNCGPGADVAHLDALDVVPVSSDFNACETVTRSSTGAGAPGGGATGGGGAPPGAGGGTPPGPGAPAGVPRISIPARPTVAKVAASGIKVAESCPSSCRVSAAATVATATRARYHLSSRTIASASGSRSAAGALTLRLRLTASAKRRLKHARRVKLSVHVTVSGADGIAHRTTKSITLA